jgi:hypothetical protein
MTFWWPWRLLMTTLIDDPDSWWWRHFDDPCYDLWLPCDYPAWRLLWPMWSHFHEHIVVRYSLSPWLRPCEDKDDKVMTRMTNDPKWWCGKSCVTTDVSTADNTWWPKWWPKYDPGDPNNNRWLPWAINVMTCWWPSKFSSQHLTTPSGDIYHQSRKLPVLRSRHKTGGMRLPYRTIQ